MITGTILTPTGWLRGRLTIDNGRIASLDGSHASFTFSGHKQGPYILPGFIDLHVHGGGGADLMDDNTSLPAIARAHARHGTTAFLPSTLTASQDELKTALSKINSYLSEQPQDAAFVLGVHMEGPYVNPLKLGAQPDHAQVASWAHMEEFLSLAPVKIVTLSPECPGADEIIHNLSLRGIRVQLGHSLASYDQGIAAMAQGATGFTHLYNAMSEMHHRHPGLAGAALAHGQYAEIIPDLIHVHPAALRVALRCIPNLYGVTDASASAGMPDGQYILGKYKIYKRSGAARLLDGTLAGSTLTMQQAFRNLVSIGLSIEEASHRLSCLPARYLGLLDRGAIVLGAWADLVVLDDDLKLTKIYMRGAELAPAEEV